MRIISAFGIYKSDRLNTFGILKLNRLENELFNDRSIVLFGTSQCKKL